MPGNFHAIPASVIATWPAPNYVDPVERTWMPALVGVLVGVSTILIAGRFYLRARGLAGSFGYDDLFIFIGWAVSIGFATTAILGAGRYYLRVHTWDVPLEVYVSTAKNAWISQILFFTSTCATKASILLFYRRMAKDTYDPKWRWAIWAALLFTFLYFATVIIVYSMICTPLDAYWKSYDFSYDKKFTCLDGRILSPLVGALSLLSDLYATVLPWVMLANYDLQVPVKQKIALNIIFSLSLVVAGCGGARLYYLWRIIHTYDTSWTGYSLFVWSLLECHLAVIFACAPAMRAFVRRYLADPINRTFGSRSKSAGSRTVESSMQNASTVRNSAQVAPAGKRLDVLDEKWELTKPNQEAAFSHSDRWSRRSSDTAAPITSAEEYELYNMRTLRKHGYQSSKSSELTRNQSSATNHNEMIYSQHKTWYNAE